MAINIGISYAMEMALPYAVTALEACGATTSASFVSGTVHGFTGNFEWSAFGIDSKLSYIEQAGLAIGFTRSYISGKNVTGAIQSIASREMAGNVAAQVTPKAKSVTNWFAKSSARQAAQETTATTVQKTTKAAVEKGVVNEVVSQKTTQIWTSTKTRSSVKNAFEHWKDHGKGLCCVNS